MYTQCPACKTVFRLHPDQINAAQGQVRCSRCHTIFNAVENLFRQNISTPASASGEKPPAAPTPVPTKPEAPQETTFTPALSDEPTAAGVEASSETLENSFADTIEEAFPDMGVEEIYMQGEHTDRRGEDESPPGNFAETSNLLDEGIQLEAVEKPLADVLETAFLEAGSGEMSAPDALAGTDEVGELDSLPSELAPEPDEEPEPSSLPSFDELEEVIAAETGDTVPAEALFLDEENEEYTSAPQENDFPEEALRIFDEPIEESLSFQEDEPDEELLDEDSASQPGGSKELGTPAGSEEEFGEELLSLFDEEMPDTQASHATLSEPAGISSPADDESFRFGEITANSHAGMDEETDSISREDDGIPRDNPAAAPSWDPFSEENIEALLTASEDNEAVDDGAMFDEERNRDPLISEEELDLSAWSDPAPDMEEDDELLSQRLPEENDEDELELDNLKIKSDSRSADETSELKTSSGTPTEERPSYSLPLEQEPARGSMLGALLWGSGIVVMLAGLALQYLYYHRVALAENAQLRPVLAQMCQLTGCQLPPRRDLTKLELGDHLVQFHPRYVDSLLITATLVNHADFTQPFPMVEVVMTDLEQHVIARRRFLPSDYLVGDNAGEGLRPETEVPLMLEVLDPGKKAVGFEFKFY